MGMSPNDFYEMDIEDFILKSRGFIDKRIDKKRDLRRLGAVLQAPLVSKQAPPMMSQWPIYGDDKLKKEIKRDVEEETKKTLEMHKVGGFEYVLENGKIIKKSSLN